MAKELPYFKFNISEWMLGRIQKHTESTQGMFINLCCKYWHKLGEYTLEDAIDDFDEKRILALVSSKIIIHEGKFLKIKFLDEQFNELEETSKMNSQKGLKSAEKRAKIKQQSTTVEPLLNTVEPISTDKIREDKIRREEIREDARAIFEERNFDWFKNQIDEIWIDQLPSEKKQKVAAAIENAWAFISSDSHRLKVIDSVGCKKLVNNAFGFIKQNGFESSHDKMKRNIEILKNA